MKEPLDVCQENDSPYQEVGGKIEKEIESLKRLRINVLEPRDV